LEIHRIYCLHDEVLWYGVFYVILLVSVVVGSTEDLI
jgi:hypothetical protein